MEIVNEKAKKRKKLFYACTVCNEEFRSAVQLRRHAAKHNIQFFCNIDSGGNMVIKESFDAGNTVQKSNKKLYQCTICGKAFKFPSYLKRHRMKHIKVENPMNKELLEKQNKYECEICKKKFPFPSYLKRHLTMHANQRAAHVETGKNVFSCATCGKIFEFLRNLRRHQRHSCKPTDPEQLAKLHKCCFCPNSYRFPSSLWKHKKKDHAEEFQTQKKKTVPKAPLPKRSFICNTCGKAFNSMGNLRAHDNVHTRSKMYFCDICRQSFTHTSSLKQHYMSHYGEKPFECKDCGKCFSKNYALLIHSRLHTGKLFKCDKCDKGYCTKAGLENHAVTHTGILPFKCPKCENLFRTNYALTNHIRSKCEISVVKKPKTLRFKRDATISIKPFACNTCNKTFKSGESLERHQSAHAGKYAYTCKVCDIGFIKEANYLVHCKKHEQDLRETGETKSQNTCEFCGQHFKFRYNLRIHLRRHTGEMPYDCSYCGRKFNSNLILKNHVAAIHTKDYPIRCPICDQGFCKQHKLRDHLRTHYRKGHIKPQIEEEISSEDNNESD